MEATLPLKSLVLILFCGLMALVIAIIIAKRQILRFNLKSRGLHVPIGSAAPKSLKEEIDRRLRRAKEIKYEPHLLKGCEDTFKTNINGEACHFLYRMKAIDALVLLDEELASYSSAIKRKFGSNLRGFLLEQRISGPLQGIAVNVLERFSESYEHARHEPAEFRASQYEEYMELLNQIVEHIRNKKNENKFLAKGKDIEKSLLTATFVPSSQDSKVDNRIISQVAANNVPDGENPVQVTYRPTSKNKALGTVIMKPGGSSSSSAGECSSSLDASSEHSSKGSAKFETSV